MRVIVALFVTLCVLGFASSRNVAWTGAAGNNLWSFAGNWDINSVPTIADDVVINTIGGASVTVNSPASARSIILGGSSTYRFTLTLLSSLTVAAGGVTIRIGGSLVLQGNSELPLSSGGRVEIASGGSWIFQSGVITGAGGYYVSVGAVLAFTTSALKLIDNTNLTAIGAVTIQASTIQLARGASFSTFGNLTAAGVAGQVLIFSTDRSTIFRSAGNFSYYGNNPAQPLAIQVNATLAGLSISSGAVIFEEKVSVTGTITLPQGSTLTTQAGLDPVYIQYVKGPGTIIIDSPTEIVGFDVSWVTVADSGSLTVRSSSVTKSLSVAGKLVLLGATLTSTDTSLIAGTVTGSGKLTVSGNFEIAVSQQNNPNSFIAAEIQVAARGYTTGSAQVLFSDYGNLHILSTGTFTIGATVTFLRQGGGSPIVTNDGQFTVQLPVGGVFTLNVDYNGSPASTLSLLTGDVRFQGNRIVAEKVVINTAYVELINAVAKWGPVGGSPGGSVNLTSNPNNTSTFGDVAIAYLGVATGDLSVRSLRVNTLEIFNGDLHLDSGTTHTGTVFKFWGGRLSGVANSRLSSDQTYFYGLFPHTVDVVQVVARILKLTAQPTDTLFLTNGAAISNA